MSTISRRTLLGSSAGCLLAYSLASFLQKSGIANEQGKEEIEQWFKGYSELGERLAQGKIAQNEWQDQMGGLFKKISIPALMSRISFNTLSDQLSKMDLADRGEIFHTLMVDGRNTTEVVGPEPKQVLITKLAYIKKGRSVPPHGHLNMVSAFLNVSGEFHIRQYDKLADEGKNLVLRSTEDERCGAGTWSSVSDVRNNVHWITAKSDDCFMFTTKMIKVSADKPFHGRINVDVINSMDIGCGKMLAPKISAERASELY